LNKLKKASLGKEIRKIGSKARFVGKIFRDLTADTNKQIRPILLRFEKAQQHKSSRVQTNNSVPIPLKRDIQRKIRFLDYY
jgi:hypothetical protein